MPSNPTQQRLEVPPLDDDRVRIRMGLDLEALLEPGLQERVESPLPTTRRIDLSAKQLPPEAENLAPVDDATAGVSAVRHAEWPGAVRAADSSRPPETGTPLGWPRPESQLSSMGGRVNLPSYGSRAER